MWHWGTQLTGHGGGGLGLGLGIFKVFSNLVDSVIPYPPLGRGHSPAVGVGLQRHSRGRPQEAGMMGWCSCRDMGTLGQVQRALDVGSPGPTESRHGLKGAAPIPSWMEKVRGGGNGSRSQQINALSRIHPLSTTNSTNPQ